MKKIHYWLRAACLWLLATVVLMPLVMTFAASLMQKSELLEHIGSVMTGGSGMANAPLLPRLTTLVQYVSLLMDTPKFLDMFWNLMGMVLPIVAGQVVIGTLAAWGFARYRFPFRNGLFLLYIALMMLPFQVTLVPNFLVLDRLGLMDTPWAVILPGIFSTFAVFLLRQFLIAIPESLIEAARIDGAGELRIFFSIGLALGHPGIASLCILSFLDYWNLIEQPMTFISSQDKWPLSLYLTRIGESNLEVAMAASVIALIAPLLMFFYFESYLVKGIQMSGMKE
ncbi:MAG: carbohydrate ABC transporter permease [Clostridiales bacterium]|nr:carbohydrate ABC transporter permease [Clostridiales bacterium]